MASPGRRFQTPNVKAKPAIPAYKVELLKRCEEQVKARRTELRQAIRARTVRSPDGGEGDGGGGGSFAAAGAGGAVPPEGAAPAGMILDVLADLLADQDAQMRDEGATGAPNSTGGLRNRVFSKLPRGYGDADDDDDGGDESEMGLTEQERVAFLTHLQEQLLRDDDDDDRYGGAGAGAGAAAGRPIDASAAAAAAMYAQMEAQEAAYAREHSEFYVAARGSNGDALSPRAGGGGAARAAPLGGWMGGDPYASPPPKGVRLAGRVVAAYPDPLEASGGAGRAGGARVGGSELDLGGGGRGYAGGMMHEEEGGDGAGGDDEPLDGGGAFSPACGEDALDGDGAVLCPVCRRRPLSLFYSSTSASAAIHCGCGLALDTSGGLTLEALRAALAAAYDGHGRACAGPALVRQVLRGGAAHLLLSCAECGAQHALVSAPAVR